MAELDGMIVDVIRAEHGDGGDDDEDELNDFGLYFPIDYVITTWQERRNHGILPEPGGLNDQDWRLVYHDWPIANARYNTLSEQLYPSDKDKAPVDPTLYLPGNPKPLKDIL